MEINVLCIGDIVGRPGRLAVARLVPEIVEAEKIDCVIANSENVASGAGMTRQLYDKLLKAGVNVFTMGDHIYRKPDIVGVLEHSPHIGKPANLPKSAIGRECVIHQTPRGPKIAVISLLGRLYMKTQNDCPYHAVYRVLAQLPGDVAIRIIDFHAEATSEKIAMGWHLDGRVSLVFGTHTHVPTADETILPKGTGYISDLGMTGPYDSVLGRQKERVLRAFVTGMPARFDVATGDPRLAGIIATIDSQSGKTLAIKRIMHNVDLPELQSFDNGND